MTATPAWKITTHSRHDAPGSCTTFVELPDFEGIDDALASGEDFPGLLDWEAGVGLFSRSGRTPHLGTVLGIAVEGDHQNDGEDALREAGANPDLYDLSSADYFLAWTFFAAK